MKKAIYYIRDDHNAPRVTVCLMRSCNGVVSRGLALCSLKDSPAKRNIGEIKGGIAIATERASRAFNKGKSNSIIWRPEAKEVLEAVGDREFLYKSEYNITPRNEFEENLIARL